tara:strand:- start:59 stop:199 length:141 start_codon:yes stop_codon:yes gene_type:complete
MVRKFKKPSGYICIYDPKVHSPKYLEELKSKFDEVKKEKPKSSKKK